MATFYSEYVQRPGNIIHGEHNGKPLVLGWLVQDIEAGTEIRYALASNGWTARTAAHKIDDVWFNKGGTKWYFGDPIPGYAQFIGQYVNDIFGPEM